jgi:hypothetical protein
VPLVITVCTRGAERDLHISFCGGKAGRGRVPIRLALHWGVLWWTGPTHRRTDRLTELEAAWAQGSTADELIGCLVIGNFVSVVARCSRSSLTPLSHRSVSASPCYCAHATAQTAACCGQQTRTTHVHVHGCRSVGRTLDASRLARTHEVAIRTEALNCSNDSAAVLLLCWCVLRCGWRETRCGLRHDDHTCVQA